VSWFWSDVVSLVGVVVLVSAVKVVWRRVRPGPPVAPPSEAEARELVRQGKQIQAMRVIREARGITLREAKQWTEDVAAGL
jgi:hypothetical protein